MPDPGFPDETTTAATLRDLTRAMTVVATPWAAGDLLGWWAVPVALLAVVGTPALVRLLLPFPAEPPPGPLSAPGLVRVVLAFDLATIGIASVWYLLGWMGAAAGLGLALATAVTGLPRTRWLLAGARPSP